MPKCNRCGQDTELYEADIPVCPACLDEQERKGCPKRRNIPKKGDPTKEC